MSKNPKKAEVFLEYNPVIQSPPVSNQQLYHQSCSNDSPTIERWRDDWLKNIKANYDRFGGFQDKGIGKFYNFMAGRPVIIAGAGPSLKKNAEQFKGRPAHVGLVSCLHNFHFMEDIGANVDFYVTLDAGPVTIEEVYEGGTRSPDEYWAATKGKKLLAFIGTHPDLLAKWQGEVFFFNAPVPDNAYHEGTEYTKFYQYLGTGGNVLGACFYFAKAWLCASAIIFTGADFSFSYTYKFHGWDSKYDKDLGQYLLANDIYGNKVKTWRSYHNFAAWFNCICNSVPGIYINCTEGGILGAFPEGNIAAIRQMDLDDCLRMFGMSSELKEQAEHPEIDTKKLLF
jgi:hypothetical protein